MAEMGKYCKAYPVQSFREFPGWKENAQNLRKEKPSGAMSKEMSPNGAPPAEQQRTLAADDHLYLQENFNVTDGIFIDENIVFDDVTPQWIDYCKNTLKFELPASETVEADSSVQ